MSGEAATLETRDGSGPEGLPKSVTAALAP